MVPNSSGLSSISLTQNIVRMLNWPLHLHNSIGKPKLIGKTYTKARKASVGHCNEAKDLGGSAGIDGPCPFKGMSAIIATTI